ncbi:hypothetical protein DFQ26_005007 [Actinomortierella ambigua]|nr:hypothetical protein DFQ26_005007 [Actinomortierella ambigua]
MSKEYRQFLKAARVCMSKVEQLTSEDIGNDKRFDQQQDHAFNTVITILANGQFTSHTLLAQSYKQLGPTAFLQLSRSLAHHGFWGRLITWAYLQVKEDSAELQRRIHEQDQSFLQTVADEAEMFELFNPGVNCQRPAWNHQPMPDL